MSKNSAGRVLGVGGIFFKAADHEALVAWYEDKLGMKWSGYGFHFRHDDDSFGDQAFNLLTPFADDTSYFAPSTRDFIINLRVDDLDALLAKLAAKDVHPVDDVLDEPYGKFAWIVDPAGIKIELWQQKGPAPAGQSEQAAADDA